MIGRAALLVLILLVRTALAAGPKTERVLSHQETSPLGDISVKYYIEMDENKLWTGDNPFQIWLQSKNDPNNLVLLFACPNGATVVFSPDEGRLAINHHVLSDLNTVHIFRRQAGLHYVEEKGVGDEVWNYFSRKVYAVLHDGEGGTWKSHFDHQSLRCKEWSRDGSAVLIEVSGHSSDVENYARAWRCVFDFRTMRPTMDLSALNRGEVVSRGKPIDSTTSTTLKSAERGPADLRDHVETAQ